MFARSSGRRRRRRRRRRCRSAGLNRSLASHMCHNSSVGRSLRRQNRVRLGGRVGGVRDGEEEEEEHSKRGKKGGEILLPPSLPPRAVTCYLLVAHSLPPPSLARSLVLLTPSSLPPRRPPRPPFPAERDRVGFGQPFVRRATCPRSSLGSGRRPSLPPSVVCTGPASFLRPTLGSDR